MPVPPAVMIPVMPVAMMKCSNRRAADRTNSGPFANRDAGQHGTRNGAASGSNGRATNHTTCSGDRGGGGQRQHRRSGNK